jgi:bifunctional non-homologous end joining protein LigD
MNSPTSTLCATRKIFVDRDQNDRHKSTVAPYWLRAKLRHPTVSLLIAWHDLAEARDADDLLWSPEEAIERAADNGDLFAPVLSLRQHCLSSDDLDAIPPRRRVSSRRAGGRRRRRR